MSSLANAADDKTNINGLYFDLFDWYGSGTCRFTADFGPTGMQSTYTGNIDIPSTVTYNSKSYTVTTVGANVLYNSTGVKSIRIPSTITAIEDMNGSPTIFTVVCYVDDPDQIKDSQKNGKVIKTSNSNLYKLGNYSNDCVLVVPTNSKNKYIANGWNTVFEGGVYENAWFKMDDKTRVYGDNNPELTFTYSIMEPMLQSPTYSCTATKKSPVGTYLISFDNKVGVLESGIATFKDGTLTVTKAPLTVTAKNYTIKQGDPLPTFEATYSGFKNSETASVLTTQPTISCSATSSSAPGTYDIIVSGGSASNYAFTYVNGTLTIEAIANIQFADANVKSICVSHWDTNNDGELSFDEAAAIKTISDYFANNTSITLFDEFAYFTGVTTIGERAFEGCSGLTSITIPNSVTSIGTYAFDGCSGITSITIPNSVTSIGNKAFNSCLGLTKVIVSDIAAWCKISFEDTDVYNPCYANPLSYAHHLYCDENTEITDLVIPNSVTSIGEFAFDGCSGLTSITIPNSVTSIGNDAFSGCSGMTSITIPNSVTSIGGSAFADCFGLTSFRFPNKIETLAINVLANCHVTSIIIPASVKTIEQGAFVSCQQLKDVYCLATDVPETHYLTFYNLNTNNVTLHVPSESVSAYSSASVWNTLKQVVALTPDEIVEIGDADGDDAEISGTDNYITIHTNTTGGYAAIGWHLTGPDFLHLDSENLDNDYIIAHISKIVIDNHEYNYQGSSLEDYGLDLSVEHTIKVFFDTPLTDIDGLFGNRYNIDVLDMSHFNASRLENMYNCLCGMVSLITWVLPADLNITLCSKRTVTTLDTTTLLHVYCPANRLDDYKSFFIDFDTRVYNCLEANNSYYSDNQTSTLTISPIDAVTYNGLAQTPTVTVKDGNTTLTEGTDYTVSYSDNTNAGMATVTITGKGNYTGTKTANFTINKAPLTVTAQSYTITQGDPLPAFECSYNGFVNSETASMLTTQPTISCSATSSSAPGAYDIVVSGGSATNYAFTYVNGTLTIEAISKPQCATPTIAMKDGKLHFECETEGVKFIYDIQASGNASGEGNDLDITPSYVVKVYATKDGYEDSDVATETIKIIKGDTDGDGVVDIADAVRIVNFIVGKIPALAPRFEWNLPEPE